MSAAVVVLSERSTSYESSNMTINEITRKDLNNRPLFALLVISIVPGFSSLPVARLRPNPQFIQQMFFVAPFLFDLDE